MKESQTETFYVLLLYCYVTSYWIASSYISPFDQGQWSSETCKMVATWFQVRQFKGQTYIDIREYYSDKKTMELMPGKKGISRAVLN